MDDTFGQSLIQRMFREVLAIASNDSALDRIEM
jgi:hypothetical protein